MYGFKNRKLETDFDNIKENLINYNKRNIFDNPVIDFEIRKEIITTTYVYKNKVDRDFDFKLINLKIAKCG